jgi:hypothetical protein
MTASPQAPLRPDPTVAGKKPSSPSRVVAVVLLAAVAAVTLAGFIFRSTDRQVETFDEPITAIEIDADAGAISLRATSADEATLTTTREWSLGRSPDVTTSAERGILRVTSRCGSTILAITCSARLVLDVPAGTPVTVKSRAGAIDADGLTAGLTAETRAGAITVTDVAGDVALRTSAGSIDATVASRRIDARSSAGAVTIVAHVVPEMVAVSTSAGGVDIAVPRSSYRVDADSSAGDVAINVPTDPEASRTITARSSAGAVQVHQLDD